jgi:L-gulonolactone oxidase
VKVAGAGHSFTDIACTDGALLRLERYDRVLRLDAEARLATVQAGMSIHALNLELARHGLALRNMGDIDYQSIAGAISTSTHGTGLRQGNLSSQVTSLSLVLADGSVLECSEERDPVTFRAALVGLGALGVVSTVTLRCVPAFLLHNVEDKEPFDSVLDDLDARVEANDHFELFWFPYTDAALTIVNNVSDGPARPRGALHRWFNDIVVENRVLGLLQRTGRARPSLIPGLNRLTARAFSRTERVDESHAIFANPRLVRFAEMEYAIPRAAARDAISELRAMLSRIDERISFPIEVRFGPSDDITLSTASGRETCYIAVHVFHRMPYEPYFREVEAIMNAHAGRPHWGKLHFQDAATLSTRYPRWDSFVEVRNRLDPAGVFANDYLDRVIGPPVSRHKWAGEAS